MDYLIEKYIVFVSSRLRNFKRKSAGVYNFSCHFCGDSKKSKSKARAYLYEKSGDVWFTCHNCNKPIGGFENFLRQTDYGLFQEYWLERFGTKQEEPKFVPLETKPFRVVSEVDPLAGVPKVSDLSPFDIVRTYVVQRKLPTHLFDKLYACQNFKKFTNKFIPGKFSEKSLFYDDYRLLLPFFDEKGVMFAYAGRAIEAASKLRYINIVLDETKPKIYGMDRWDRSKPTYVVEGPIDSLFLPNAIATAGGSLISQIGDHKDNTIIVYDNEPNSKTTLDKMRRAVEEGFKVCIWPRDLRHKDINKMVLAGIAPTAIENIIKSNTFEGLEAEIRLNLWNF